MKVIDLTPRGFCHGVENAINIVKRVINDNKYPRPIYILGQIVHNKNVTLYFKEHGVISLDEPNIKRMDLLDNITKGTVIFTAHGISPNVVIKAKEKGLTVINATCSDVLKVHKIIRKKLKEGYQIIYIGKKNHPEPEAILDLDKSIKLVTNIKDILMLENFDKKVFVTNQTTLSKYDIKEMITYLSEKFPDLEFSNEICDATTLRQEAVINQEIVDLTLVVGDKLSSNSNKLVEVCQNKAYLIGGIEDIKDEWLENVKKVSVTSGASTPSSITDEVIAYLKNYSKDQENLSKIKYSDIL